MCVLGCFCEHQNVSNRSGQDLLLSTVSKLLLVFMPIDIYEHKLVTKLIDESLRFVWRDSYD